MSEKKQKFLQTQGKLRQRDDTVKPGGGVVMTGKPPGMNPFQYIGKYGTSEEIIGLVNRIEKRRSKLPKFIYLICEKCGYQIKLPFADRDIKPPQIEYCNSCNFQRYTDGATVRKMTKAESIEYDKTQAENWKTTSDRATAAAFFHQNQARQKEGLEPLTMAQFLEREKRRLQEIVDPSRAIQRAR